MTDTGQEHQAPHEDRAEFEVSRTVLICDDAIFMRRLIAQVMTQAGFEVIGEAENGLQAIRKYQELRPDVVTMDLLMPEMTGIDAVRQIIKDDSDACIVMCSSMGQEALTTEAMEAGARSWVVKPFSPPQLVDAIESALQLE